MLLRIICFIISLFAGLWCWIFTCPIQCWDFPDEFNFVWVEQGELPAIDECGTRTIGIRFREIDLTQPVQQGHHWHEIGLTVKPQSNLTSILCRSIATRNEAAYVANKILEFEVNLGGGLVLELMQVEYDPIKNIWIFGYWENRVPPIPGRSYHVAVNGASGELLRMWVL